MNYMLIENENYMRRKWIQMPTLEPPGLAVWERHIPGAWAGLDPKDGPSCCLRWWGGCVSKWALPWWTRVPGFLCMGQSSSDPAGLSCSYTKPVFPPKRCVLWVRRALKSHPVSTSAGGGRPTSSLLLNHFTILPQQSQPSTLVGLGICLEGEG